MDVMKSGSLNIEAVQHTHLEVTNAVCDVTISDLPRGGHPNTLAQSWRRGPGGVRPVSLRSVVPDRQTTWVCSRSRDHQGSVAKKARPSKPHQNPSKPHQNPSESMAVFTMYKPSESIRIHQNPSKSIRIHRNPLKSIKINDNL